MSCFHLNKFNIVKHQLQSHKHVIFYCLKWTKRFDEAHKQQMFFLCVRRTQNKSGFSLDGLSSCIVFAKCTTFCQSATIKSLGSLFSDEFEVGYLAINRPVTNFIHHTSIVIARAFNVLGLA